MNIDLATFNINTDKLFADFVKTREEIAKLRAEQRRLQTDFVNSNKSVAENREKYNRLQRELSELTTGTVEYSQAVARLENAEQALNESLVVQTRINSTYQTQLSQNQLELNRLNNQARSYQTVLDAQNRATNESIDLYSRQRAELTLLQREQRELGVQLERSRRETGEFSAQTLELTRAYNQASVGANSLAEELRGIDRAGGNNTSNIGNYESALNGLNGAFDNFRNGDIKGGFDQIKESVSGLFKALIANPILGLVAGILVAGKAIFDFNAGIKESNKLLDNLGLDTKIRPQIDGLVNSFDVGFKEVANAVDQIMDLGLAKDQADALEQIKLGLVKAPDKEAFLSSLENNAQAAKNLGINLNEVIALQQSFEATGSNAEATFGALEKAQLNLTKSNPELLKSLSDTLGATFSNDVLNKVKTGEITYTQALDQIKKKGDELKINSQQQADLQVALFGKSAVSAGGYEQILNNVANAQNKQNEKLTDQQKATLELANANQKLEQALSDAFEIKGFAQGWDSLKASATLALANIISYLGDLKKDIQPLIDLIATSLSNTWEAVSLAFSLFFNLFSNGIKVIKNNLKTFIDVFSALLRGDFQGALASLTKGFSNLTNIIGNSMAKIKNSVIDNVKSIVTNIKPLLSALGVDVDKLQKKLDSVKSNVATTTPQTTTTSQTTTTPQTTTSQTTTPTEIIDTTNIDDAKKKRDDAQKALEDAQKKELESISNLADEKLKLAQLELGIYIEKNKSILENEKYLTNALADEEKQRLLNIQKNKLDVLAEENELQNKKLQTQIKAINTKDGINQTEKNQLETLRLQQKEIELKYDADVLGIKNETQKQITAIDTRYSNERIEAEKMRKAIAFQTELLELEAKGASEQEIRTAQLDQQTQIEVDKLVQGLDAKFQAKIEKDAENLTVQQEIDLAQEELQNEINLAKDENELIRLQTQLDALNNIEIESANKKLAIENAVNQQKLKGRTQVLQGFAQLVGQESELGKALGIANIIQEKASAISGIYSNLAVANLSAIATSPLTAGQPWVGINTAQAGIQTGIAVATGAASIAQILGLKVATNISGVAGALTGVQTLSGFSEGGYTGDGSKYQPAGIVHAGEVVFSQADVNALGGAMAVNSMRPTAKGYANGGIVGNSSSLGSIQSQISNAGIDTELLASVIGDKVMAGAMAGTENGSARGISGYNDNQEIISKSKF